MKTRVFCWIVAIVMLTLLVVPLSLADDAKPFAGTKIRFATFQTGAVEEDWVNVQFPRFLEETGIEVEHVFFNQADTISTLMTWTAAGTAPDVAMLSAFYQNALAAQGLLLDLDAYIAESQPDYPLERFFPKLLNAYKYKGVQYALPSDMDLGLVWYNKDMFDAASVAYPSNDWTWDDYYATAKALTSGEGPGKIFGSEMPPIQHFLWQSGGDYFSADGLSCTLDIPESKEAYEFIVGLMNEGIVPRERLSEGGFNAGKAAMALGSGPWYAYYMLNDVDFSWDVAAMPQHTNKATTAYGSSFAILKTSQKVDAAFEFISWFLSDEQQFIRAKQFCWFPPSSTVLDYPGFEGEDVLNMNAEQKQLVMDEAEFGRAPLVVLNQNEINQITTRENTLIWSGEKSIDDGVAAMVAEINPLLVP